MKRLLQVLPLVLATYFTSQARMSGAEPAAAGAPLRVGVAPVSPPMVFKEAGKLAGVEVDLANGLGKELGRPVRFVELEWEKLIEALNAGQIDIIMSSMSITKARQFRIAFSEPYLRIGQMALVRGDERYKYVLLQNSLSDRAIGTRKATTGDLLIQQEFPRAKRKFFKSGDEAAKALQAKKIDLYIDDSTVVWYTAGAHEASGLAVAPMLLSEEYLGWGLRRSDSELLDSVNAYLKKAQGNGELERIRKRWLPNLE